MNVFLKHYSELVEKLTGTPAAETIALLKDEMEKEFIAYQRKLNDQLINEEFFKVLNNPTL